MSAQQLCVEGEPGQGRGGCAEGSDADAPGGGFAVWPFAGEPNARQIRDTDDCDEPLSFAIERVDQYVAFFGVASSVLVTTVSTCSSVTVLGPPGRGMSPGPAIRYRTNRAGQRPTACGVESS